jgi:hypothetical protein
MRDARRKECIDPHSNGVGPKDGGSAASRGSFSRDIVHGAVPDFVGDEGYLPDELWLAPKWRSDPCE